MTGGEERFMVLVADGGATVAAVTDVDRLVAWAVARERRETGVRVWIMRIDGGRHECVVDEDDPL